MELKRIKEIMAAMQKAGATRLRLKEKEEEIELEMGHMIPMAYEAMQPTRMMASKPSKPGDIPASLLPPVDQGEKGVEEVTGNYVTSPMVGTFYETPSPEDPPFVKVGDRVEKETVVCIIEAMKVMNEVKAGVAGTVTQVLVENSHPVEFGTKLFLIS